MSHGSPPRLCGARLSNGRGFCRARALTGKLRCQFHGGRSTGPKTAEGKKRTVEAMAAGRARWIEEMRKLKASGLIEKIPGGRRPGAQPRKTGDKIIDRARTALAERRAELVAETAAAAPVEVEQDDQAEEGQETTLPAPAGRSWNRMSPTAKLLTLTGKSLDTINHILDMPDDEGATLALKLKLLSIKKDAALSVLATQVKVDENRLRARRGEDGIARLLEEMRKHQLLFGRKAQQELQSPKVIEEPPTT